MTRSPHRTRNSKHDDDQGEEKVPTVRDRLALSARLLQPIEPFSGDYTNDDEKKKVYTNLIRLKAARKTNRECADLLGVSPRTIDNYKADPYYVELQTAMESDAKQEGYHTLAEIIPDAMGVAYDIMMHDKSGFVRFKAAELFLNYAGYAIPRESAQQSNRDAVDAFFKKMDEREAERRRAGMPVQVNVQINTGTDQETTGSNMVVSSTEVGELQGEQPPFLLLEEGILPQNESMDALLADVPEELRPYYVPLDPGGRLPKGFL